MNFSVLEYQYNNYLLYEKGVLVLLSIKITIDIDCIDVRFLSTVDNIDYMILSTLSVLPKNTLTI